MESIDNVESIDDVESVNDLGSVNDVESTNGGPVMSGQTLTLALAQVKGHADPARNLETARRYAAEARERGAALILFPEMFMALPERNRPPAAVAESLEGPFASALGEIAREQGLYLAAGMWEKSPDPDRAHNVAALLSPDGSLLTAYRKIHLFDALNIRESDRMAPGGAAPEVVTVAGFRVFLSICYDLRFPELYRKAAAEGAQVALVPSAWYAGPMKETHWRALLRARAIENTFYIAGANQAEGPFSGRSAVFDPFGVGLAEAGEAPGLILARIEARRIAEVRNRLPCLDHRRPDLF